MTTQPSSVIDLPQTPLDATAMMPLAGAQPGIWHAHQLGGESGSSFNVARCMHIDGVLDEDAFATAVHRTLVEVDTLGFRFGEVGGEPVQWQGPPQRYGLEVVDLRGTGSGAAESFMDADLGTAVSLGGADRLYRQALLRLGDTRWIWYQRFHHILLDGYSFSAVTRQACAHYRAIVEGTACPPAAFTAFADVVAAERDYRDSAAEGEDAAFWRSYCAGLPPAVTLAVVDTRAAGPGRARRHEVRLGTDLSAAISTIARAHKVTWADVLVAGIGSYVARMTNSGETVLGIPFMNRTGGAALRAGGPVVAVMPLRLALGNNETLGGLAAEAAAELAAVRRHSRYGAEHVLRDAGLVGSGRQLHGPVLNLKIFDYAAELPGATVHTEHLSAGPVDDLEFAVYRLNGDFALELEATPGRYSAAELALHAARLQAWLATLADGEDTGIDEAALPLADEIAAIQTDWSSGPALETAGATVMDRLDRQAADHGNDTALVAGGERMDFAELGTRSNTLARHLIALGAGPGSTVAIALPRSLDTVVAVAAALAAGAAYLPLDLDYPEERLAYMLDDAAPQVLLTTAALADRLDFAGCVVSVDDAATQAAVAALEPGPVRQDERSRPVQAGDLAYIIYTSGSTGRPKGVMTTHAGLSNLLANHECGVFGQTVVSLGGRRVRAAHSASFSFDSSWEQLIWMFLGHELHVMDDEQRRDPQAIVDLVRAARIDAMDVTPSLGTQLLECGLLAPGEHHPALLLFGGEAAPAALWDVLRATPGTHSHNFYGPTEYTVDTLGAATTDSLHPVVGRPIGNTRVYVLDSALRPVPVGVVGELYIAGAGLARGYLGRPDLTAARFVADPAHPGGRMYRTGDLVRWQDDGQIDCLGRVDDQVKVRGHRVELGEVEDAVGALPGVGAAVVVAEALGHTNRLIGYFVPGAGSPLSGERAPEARLRAELAQTLPDHMVPAVLVRIPALPLTVNGKVDRASLPAPAVAVPVSGRPPANQAEALLCKAVADVVGLPAVGPDDDFFVLGGDSISAMAVCGAARRAGQALRPRDVFAQRTPAAMAAVLVPLEIAPHRALEATGDVEPLPIQRWLGETAGLGSRYAQGTCVTVPGAVTAEILRGALAEVFRVHPALRARVVGDVLHIPATPAPSGLPDGTVRESGGGTGEAFGAAAERLDPAAGAMVQAVLLDGALPGKEVPQARRLVLAIHHLVVDGVSWRTLLADLEAAVTALLDGRDPQLEPEQTSLRRWGLLISGQAASRRTELEHWRRQLQGGADPLGRGLLDPVRDTVATAGNARIRLSEAATAALLESLPQACQATVEETLMTVVALAAAHHFKLGAVPLTRETHGRHSDEEDLERTVGWLTAEHPVLIPLDGVDTAAALAGSADALAAVRAVKQALRSTPGNGIGYGILRYLHPDSTAALAGAAAANPPALLLNYLGRFPTPGRHFTPVPHGTVFADAFAVAQDGQAPLGHPLELNAFLDGGRLALCWSWAPRLLNGDDVAALAGLIERAAIALGALAKREPVEAASTLVPADVPGTGLDTAALTAIEAGHGPVLAVLPLGPLHEGLLFHDQLGKDGDNYCSVTVLEFADDQVSADRLRQAIEHVIDTHPQLGASFDTTAGPSPVQVVPHPAFRRPVDFAEVVIPDGFEAPVETLLLERREAARVFDVGRGPLLSARLVRWPDGSARLLLGMHHLLVDGWSTPLIVSALLDCYESGQAGPSTLGKYREASAARLPADTDGAAWSAALKGAVPTLLEGTLVAAVDDGEPAEATTLLDAGLLRGLTAAAQRYGATHNSIFALAHALMLGELTGRTDVVFGTTVSGREDERSQELIGLFTNTVPVRVMLDPTLPPALQLGDLQEQQAELREHARLGLAEIQHLAGTGTLFDSLFVMENYPADGDPSGREGSGLRLSGVRNRGYTHYPLTVLVLPESAGYRVVVEHRLGEGAGAFILPRFLAAVSRVVSDGGKTLVAAETLLDAERAALQAANDTRHALPPVTLRDLLDGRGVLADGAVALRNGARSHSHAELRERVLALARRLRSAGVATGDIVAVSVPRSAELTISLLAVIEAGAAYLPLDTEYPAERLAYMLADAAPQAVLTTVELAPGLPAGTNTILVDGAAVGAVQVGETGCAAGWRLQVAAELTPDHPAYVIYTSGSTGRPKGVVVPHRAIVNRLLWMQDAHPLGAEDVVVQKTPSSFDVSVWEFFWPFLAGASQLVVPPGAHKDPVLLRELMRDGGATTVHFVPSMLAAFLADAGEGPAGAGLPALRRAFCSGEALSRELAAKAEAAFGVAVHNLYGPTEAAVDVSWFRGVDPVPGQLTGSVPIGAPVWNTELHVLDGMLRPAPPGVAGELYLAGAQLATGYLGKAGLTAGRYVANPYGTGVRMYRTGDIVRRLPGGDVEYLGRADDQVKIRGQRIELGEIESVLADVPGIGAAVVAARAAGGSGGGAAAGLHGADDRILAAYIVPTDHPGQGADAGPEVLVARCREACERLLPAHMVPVAVLVLGAFPLTSNGKLDRNALPDPAPDRRSGRRPRGVLEEAVAAGFTAVLGVPDPGAADDFFALGGHSLLAMRLAAWLGRELGRKVPVGSIMAAGTVEALARRIKDASDGREAFGEVLPIRQGSGNPLFCIHPASGFAWQYRALARYLDGDQALVGLQSPRPVGALAGASALSDVHERHYATIRSLQPHGPYSLLGYSLGGTIAHALAARLAHEGEKVSFLGLLDTYPPEGQDWSAGEAAAEAEAEREQRDLGQAAGQGPDGMDADIVANYKDSVRLLSSAVTPHFPGKAELFVAAKTLPEGYEPQAAWAGRVQSLSTHGVDCRHEDILSPETLPDLGPRLARLLAGTKGHHSQNNHTHRKANP